MVREDSKEFKSYYDIPRGKGAEYIGDEKSLAKIRNKSLRRFLKLLELHRLTPWATLPDEDTMKILHRREGATLYMLSITNKELLERGLNPEILKLTSTLSKRTLYDYMNAIKYIKAIDEAEIEAKEALLGSLGKG